MTHGSAMKGGRTPVQPGIHLLENSIQHYAWGSPTAFTTFLGIPNPEGTPMAELWMGAHPKAPSYVRLSDGERVPLGDLIERDPVSWLGAAAPRYGNVLPFLFKVLGVTQPLSIQAHPNKEQAREGFERENREGIPLDAPHRNYRDPNHKPEVICAVTPFWALRGFRSPGEIARRFTHPAFEPLEQAVRDLRIDPTPSGLSRFFRTLMTLEPQVKREVVTTASVAFRDHPEPEYQWLLRLADLYPGDIGALAPLYLNLVKLAPGEAMFLPAGELHAYLEGVGVELMANSDNVLRGGCTPKHVDVPELLRVLTFRGKDGVEVLSPREVAPGLWAYDLPTGEFALSCIEADDPVEVEVGSVEILVLLGDHAIFSWEGGTLELSRGQSVVVAAVVGRYEVSVEGRLYRASLPVA
ncbi:mannose-6-phosphate isomerase, class I [Spirochaeta thermophila]|nr:mannose-6-phosphate isomerase, class I [Spirochaeta thermophila]